VYSEELKPNVSVILLSKNDISTIAKALASARNVDPLTEIIVVDHGSTDGTTEVAENLGANVIRCQSALVQGVGRCMGARAANGDILLFARGDLVLGTEELLPFVEAVKRGVDVALNPYEGHSDRSRRVGLSKRVLNSLLSATWLGAASLTTFPHALSRKALEVIGWKTLYVPPKAHAIAVVNGLIVEPVVPVDDGTPNPGRRKSPDLLTDLIIGDHLEAINWLLGCGNPRVNFPDLGRLRGKVRD